MEKLLVIYNLHLESRSYGRIQLDQLDEVLADWHQHYSPETAVILGGDFEQQVFAVLLPSQAGRGWI